MNAGVILMKMPQMEHWLIIQMEVKAKVVILCYCYCKILKIISLNCFRIRDVYSRCRRFCCDWETEAQKEIIST